MKTYEVMPSEVAATGPKNFIQKGDVLSYIQAKNLKKGVKKQAKAPAETPKPAAKQPGKPSSDGAFDKTNLFK
jgi:pyruvate/2-oxoglutarate dehydrogenase complex dihydrolipoamide acyltransferase (E2) component